MLIDRIYLRNYRVFEEELELTLPPGLVGVYGPNGAGKSTLLESVLWALWGKARTAKEEVPSSGSHGECIAEVTFEHDGHIYLVRRTISGASYTVRAEAQCDGLVVAEGARDTGRYVHSVLGMDDGAFRASVFAEQKQLAAFSSQSPAERRKLVLALLGVTPLDVARDKVRADARQAADQHNRLRGMLPDLEEARVAAEDSEARAAAADISASEEEKAAAAAATGARSGKEKLDALDVVRQEHDLLVLEGRAARSELDGATKQVEDLSSELAELAGAEAKLNLLRPEAAGLEAAEGRVPRLRTVLEAAKELAGSARGAGTTPGRRDGSGGGRTSGPGGPVRARVGRSQASVGGQRTEKRQGGTRQVILAVGHRRLPPLRAATRRRLRQRPGPPRAGTGGGTEPPGHFRAGLRRGDQMRRRSPGRAQASGRRGQRRPPEASRLRAGPSGPGGRLQTPGYLVGRPGRRR